MYSHTCCNPYHQGVGLGRNPLSFDPNSNLRKLVEVLSILPHPDLDIKILISLQREPAPAWRFLAAKGVSGDFVASQNRKVGLWASIMLT